MSYTLGNIEILDPQQFTVPVCPSEFIYFKEYPYRITLRTAVDKNDTMASYRITPLQLELSKTVNTLTDKVRCKVTLRRDYEKSILLYVRNSVDLKTIVNKFSDSVQQVSGPISEEHLTDLTSRSVRITLRKKLWYDRYNCKVVGYFRLRNKSTYTAADIHFETVKNSFHKFLAPQVKIHAMQFHRFHSVSFHCDYAEFMEFMPFLKLSYPNYVFKMEKCILIDK
jgi:hypothetical protein